MNNLESIDVLELVERYNYLIQVYVPLAAEIAPKLEKFGKIRQELQIISAEFVKRGYKVDESESLKKMIEEELKKRNMSVDVIAQTNQNEGTSESKQNSK